MEIKVLSNEILNVNIEDIKNLQKNITLNKLRKQKINNRKRRINVLMGFAPTIK